MTTLSMIRDSAGENTFGLPPADDMYRALLTTNTEQNFTVPNESESGFYLAVFSPNPGATLWVAYNGNTASVPSGAAETTTSEHLPSARKIAGGSQISLISSNTASVEVGITFYAIPK